MEMALRSTAEAVTAKFGGVQALIHLIGGWLGSRTLAETSREDLESMLGQHVWTTFNFFHTFSAQLAKSGWGRVIVISPSTVTNPPAKTGAYTAAKAAQENFVLTLAAELKDKGVTANIIQVRSIDVDNTGKGTTPEEIMAAMMYLFSRRSRQDQWSQAPALLRKKLPKSTLRKFF